MPEYYCNFAYSALASFLIAPFRPATYIRIRKVSAPLSQILRRQLDRKRPTTVSSGQNRVVEPLAAKVGDGLDVGQDERMRIVLA